MDNVILFPPFYSAGVSPLRHLKTLFRVADGTFGRAILTLVRGHGPFPLCPGPFWLCRFKRYGCLLTHHLTLALKFCVARQPRYPLEIGRRFGTVFQHHAKILDYLFGTPLSKALPTHCPPKAA